MKTIQRRLTGALILTFAVPLLAGGVVVYGLIRDELAEQFDVALRARGAAVAAVMRANGPELEVSGQARFMQDFEGPERAEAEERDGENEHDESDVAYFQVRRDDGSTALRSPSLGNADLPLRSGSLEEPALWNLTLPGGAAGRAVGFKFRPQTADGSSAGVDRMSLVVATERGDLDRTLGTIGMALSAGGALLFAGTLLVIPFVVRKGLKPLDELAEQTGRIDASSLSTRLPTDGLPGELVPIAGRLNDLFGRLGASFERERRFSGDLAHELRTPIAELRSLAELALKWPDARAVDADRDALAIAIHMEGIVTRLLTLLRSENGRLPIALERVQLDDLLQRVWGPLAQQANEKSLRVSWHVPVGSAVSTDPVICRSILTNLLQNAVEYTPAGGTVEVAAKAEGQGFDVRFTNDVDRLSEDDVPRLFDRLWRQDTSRSNSEHAGLGLSLARAFASSIGCQLTASFEQPGRLTLRLRTAPSSPA